MPTRRWNSRSTWLGRWTFFVLASSLAWLVLLTHWLTPIDPPARLGSRILWLFGHDFHVRLISLMSIIGLTLTAMLLFRPIGFPRVKASAEPERDEETSHASLAG